MTPTDAAQAEEAKRLFSKGSELYLAKRYVEALDALTRSYKLVPSPNSELIAARCLREMGQLVEAHEKFAVVEVEARRRAAGGEAKYTRTADTAAAEGAAVAAGLGSIRVHIDDSSAGTKLEIDHVATPVLADGNLVVWHLPGEVAVTVQSQGGAEQKQVVTVRSGTEVKMEFARAEAAAAGSGLGGAATASFGAANPLPNGDAGVQPGDHGKRTSGARWAAPAAIVSGVFTAAGGGLFAGFGLASQAGYRDLRNRCASVGCGSDSDHAEAEAGKRNQLIADVSLVVGSVAAAATLTFIVVALTSPRDSAAEAAVPRRTAGSAPRGRPHALRLELGAGTALLTGDFE